MRQADNSTPREASVTTPAVSTVSRTHWPCREIRVAGCVGPVDLSVAVGHVRRGEFDRVLVFLKQVVVADGVTLLHLTGGRDGTACGEQGIDQGGLAHTPVADQG